MSTTETKTGHRPETLWPLRRVSRNESRVFIEEFRRRYAPKLPGVDQFIAEKRAETARDCPE